MKLIDKDKIAVEIEKRRSKNARNKLNLAASFEDNYLLSFLDSLETKEVDLEKEIETHLKECLDVKFPTTDIELIKKDVEYTARMFFELGLKAQKGEDCEKLYEEPQVYETEDGEIITYSETDGYKVVEPKFKVGDWITNEEYVWQIDEVKRENYLLIDSEGNLFAEEIAKIDSEFHLWATTDAKDGDVLVDEDNNIGIYRGEKDNSWESYIYLGCDNNLYGFNIGGYHEYKNTKPATKEQSDLLFQKIRERGYEWDTEKKELRVIDWSKHVKYEPIDPSIIEEKSVWTEEDELIIDKILGFCEDVERCFENSPLSRKVIKEDVDKIDKDKIDNWLKTIKERLKGE